MKKKTAEPDLPPEVWREVPGFEMYEASDRGRIRRATGGQGAREGLVLKGWVGPGGHQMVTLSLRGLPHPRRVADVVAETFVSAEA